MAATDSTDTLEQLRQLPSDLTAFDVRGALEDAIDALYRIWRLSDLTEGELDDNNVDGRIFLQHIAQLCCRHGSALDDLYIRMSRGTACVGHFRGTKESDFSSPIVPTRLSEEAGTT
jgi:hypothetical protein